MKSLAIALMTVAATGSAWAWKDVWLASPAEPHRITNARAQAGLRTMLDGHPDMRIANLVIDRSQKDAIRAFRGRIVRDGRSRPLYGQARQTCGAKAERAACWEIAYLEVDGSPVASLTALDATAQNRTARIETGEIPRMAAVPPAEDATALTVTLHATHRVARPVINARAGPGLENEIVTKLGDGARLSLLERRGSWGRFLVLDGPGEGIRAWASLGIVEEVSDR